MDTNNIDVIHQPCAVVFLKNNRVAIGGENGSIIGTCNNENQLSKIQKITHHRTHHLAANKDYTLLGLSLVEKNEKENRAIQAIYSIDSKELMIIPDSINANITSIAFSSIENIFFAWHEGTLLTYNPQSGTSKKYICFNTLLPNRCINCHPTKNGIIYPLTNESLAITDIHENKITNTKLMITFSEGTQKNIRLCEYSPNGSIIALRNAHQYYLVSYDGSLTTASPLTNPLETYIGCGFHPHQSIIAVLTLSGHIDFFNYKTYELIATTKPLFHTSVYKHHSKYRWLDICPQGHKLIAILNNEYRIVDIPQNNIFAIYKAFLMQEIPKDMRNYIMNTLLCYYNHYFSRFFIKDLLSVTSIKNKH